MPMSMRMVGDPSFRGPASTDPRDHIGFEPADVAAAKALLAGESAEEAQTRQHPARPASQTRHIVGGEEFFPVREVLVDVG